MSSRVIEPLPQLLIEPAVKAALAEDLGRAGDITTEATVPAQAEAVVVMRARQPGVLSGLDAARTAFRLIDPSLRCAVQKHDGAQVEPGDTIMAIEGKTRSILTGERVALNFLGHLSGIATTTHQMVQAAGGTGAKICCTRKTTPNLRAFEKFAVRCGGGVNHRFGLDDGVLIKDNHIAAAGGIGAAIAAARAHAGHMVKIEIEVDTLAQLKEALEAKADIVMLDNMAPDALQQAVTLNKGRAVLEASGQVTLDTVGEIARTGVDLISAGWITHSAPCLDVGLDFQNAL